MVCTEHVVGTAEVGVALPLPVGGHAGEASGRKWLCFEILYVLLHVFVLPLFSPPYVFPVKARNRVQATARYSALRCREFK